MAKRSKSDDQYDAVSSHSLTEETSAMKRRLLTTSTGTLTSPSHSLSSSSDSPLAEPFLPLCLMEEILCRLPVKFLLQLRCVCNSWNSLISDPKFAKKHLRVSRSRHFLMLSFSANFTLTSYPLDSVFTTGATSFGQLEYSSKYLDEKSNIIVGSCDGILCFANAIDRHPGFLWNPSIRKFKELPPLKNSLLGSITRGPKYGFGYDRLTDNYKVVAVFSSTGKTRVKVHTLGTDFWRRIHDFPSVFFPFEEGKFVSGAINWLVCKGKSCIIVSLDLGKESYQEFLPPDYVDVRTLNLGVSRDCLCFLSDHDVCVMKEYGNKESWTKLFTIPYMRDPNSYCFIKVVYISEDGKVLLKFIDDKLNLAAYDSINRTLTILGLQSIPEVSIESLISPCS